jgi:hypothetical protein
VKVAELIDYVRLLSGNTELTDGSILQALNIAQEDISRNLRAPIQTVFYPIINNIGAFNWPSDAREDGILRVYALTIDDNQSVLSSREIPVYDFNTASLYEPSWTFEPPGDVARFVVFDPSYEVATPYPVPPPGPSNIQSYRITYVVRPTKMQTMTDEPFNGRLESFHDVLAYRTAFLLARAPELMMEYERRLREARGATNHGAVTVFNPMYRRTVLPFGRN